MGKARYSLLGAALVLILGAGAAVAGYFLREHLQRPAPPPPQVATAAMELPEVPRPRPQFVLRDQHGKLRSVTEWDGRLLLLNFWATWCAPCREEIPMLMDVQDEYAQRGLRLVGVAIDQPDNVTEFVSEMGMDYPVLIGQLPAIEVSKAYGNRVGSLPFTVLVDPEGQIVYQKLGLLTRAEAEAAIRKALDG